MTTLFGFDVSFMQRITSLYRNPVYVNRLRQIKGDMTRAKNQLHCLPQYDDIEAEITCLLLMALKPSQVYEFSPCGGWSTLYLLMSTDSTCKIKSYDLYDMASANIRTFPSLFSRWEFTACNVLDRFAEFDLNMDYLFIDSDHSAEFAARYIELLLQPLLEHVRAHKRQVFVSVHDVFHSESPNQEGILVIRWLQANGLSFFAPTNYQHWSALQELRGVAGLDTSLVHTATTNPSIFFTLQ